MRRLRSATCCALFALFCGAGAGPAAAATGGLTVTGGFPPIVGALLTSSGPINPGDSIEWQTCDAQGGLSGTVLATAQTYTLASSDAGTDVCAVELDATGTVVASSAPVGPVGTGPSLNAGAGPLTEGTTITVTHGAWGAGSSAPTDVWYDCSPSGGDCQPSAQQPGPGAGYTVTAADVGSTIEALETATAPGGANASVPTAPTALVTAIIPAVSARPVVSGTPQVGDTLTASTGTWSGVVPTSYAYQWDRCSPTACTMIPGARSQIYVPVAADVGDALEALVTATAYGVSSVPYPSIPTGDVVGVASSGAPPPAPAPVVPATHSSPARPVGRLTATMQWTFRYAPRETQVVALTVEGPALWSVVTTRCAGRGCPFRLHRLRVRGLKRCRTTGSAHCRPPRAIDLAREFRGRWLKVGAVITVTITRHRDIGRYYRFVVRRRRGPAVRISCLAPGSTRPGRGCPGP